MTTLLIVSTTVASVALVLYCARDFVHKIGHQYVWPSDCAECPERARVLELEGKLAGARNLAAASLQGNVVEADVRPRVTDADLATATDSLLIGQKPRLTSEPAPDPKRVKADYRGGLTRTPAQALEACTRETTALGRARRRAVTKYALDRRAPTNAELRERAQRKLTHSVIVTEEGK